MRTFPGAPEYLPFRSAAWFHPSESPARMRWLISHVPASSGSVPSTFHDSNGNYLMLGRWIEKAPGRGYGRFLQEEILRPAGLRRARYGLPQDNCAAGHRRGEPVSHLEPSWAFAAGGMYASAPELVVSARIAEITAEQ